MPSTATSWTAANDITTNPMAVRTATSVASGMTARERRDSVRPPWVTMTQGRRRPIDGMPYRSMNGPETSFSAQGSATNPVNRPISPTVAPCLASHATSAICSRPIGTPWAK